MGQNSFENQLGIKEWNAGPWILVEESIYLIKAFVYDENGQKITLTSNVEITNKPDAQYLTVLHTNSIGSELVVQVKKQDDLSKARKSIFSSTLTAINSQLSPSLRYKPDTHKLKQQKEILVTGPVQILHPTDLILLPLLKSKDGQNIGEIWHLKAKGGSGTFLWETEEQEIASVKDQSYVRSNLAGLTTLWLRDYKNLNNFAKINVEVQPISQFEWLEDRLEVNKDNSSVVLYAIAKDQRGRLFTNCSRVQLEYNATGEGAELQESEKLSWDQLQA